jgi:hypothetical protein
VVLPLVVAAAAVPLLQPVFLGFLQLPQSAWSEGFAQVLLRACILIIGWLALDLYSGIVRGPERAVLAQWPVEPAQVVAFVVLKTAAQRWWMLPAAALVLSPVAFAGDAARWAVGCCVLLGAWLMALTTGAAVLLGAIAASEDERVAPLLDLMRGNNPRAQAAFLYAPGLVLGLVGAVTVQAAFAVDGALIAQPVAVVRLALPVVVAAVAWSVVPGLARLRWFDGTAVLAEIDARYSSLEEPEEALRVYLDGLVRFLPGRVRLYALKDLRNGWRARRTLITSAWLIGLCGAAASWTSSVEGVSRAGVVVIFGILLVASLGAAMEADEPEFLRRVLPADTSARRVARAFVVAAWVQPCLWPAVLGVWVRQGGEAALLLSGVGFAVTGGAIGLVIGSLALPRWALAVYAPVALVGGAAMARWVSGGLG